MTTTIGDNAQVPGVTSYIFSPDQLVCDPVGVKTDSRTITGGADLVRGTLLGEITVGAVGAAVAGGGNTGNGAFSALSAGAKTKVGVYTVRFTGALAYTVTNPNGVQLKAGFAAGAYTDPELNFTFTAGGTAMVAGDTATITVAAGSGLLQESLTAAVDGSQNPVSILATDAACSTAGTDLVAGVYIWGEFNTHAMTFGTGWTAAAAKTALQPLGIFLRTPGSDLTNTDPT